MGTRVVASHFPDKNLTGVSQLLEDLQRLAEDHESADVLFLLGRDEVPVYAHRIILMARCKSFQNAKRGELCRIPGSSVTPPAQPGGPAPIRLPHVQGPVFRQFILYVYTGKILLQDSAVFEMLSLATDLGVEELRSTCEDYVTSTLSPLNAATFLAAVMDIQERTAAKIKLQDGLQRSSEGAEGYGSTHQPYFQIPAEQVQSSGLIVGFDEYMNLVLDDAEEYHVKTKNRRPCGRVMLKGDNITLIQSLEPSAG